MYINIEHSRDFFGKRSIIIFIRTKKIDSDDIFIDDKHYNLINQIRRNNVFYNIKEFYQSLKENGLEEYVI
jgi:hypothetical protein